jgi:hypothetical protein
MEGVLRQCWRANDESHCDTAAAPVTVEKAVDETGLFG